jgi:hypothetical protein
MHRLWQPESATGRRRILTIAVGVLAHSWVQINKKAGTPRKFNFLPSEAGVLLQKSIRVHAAINALDPGPSSTARFRLAAEWPQQARQRIRQPKPPKPTGVVKKERAGTFLDADCFH